MTKLILLTLFVVTASAAVLVSQSCTKKNHFTTHELRSPAHQSRVSSTLEAVFNRRDFNYTIIEGHTCRNTSGTVYWYHVIAGGGDDARSEVSFVEAPNGAKRARLDYLVQEEGQQHYVYRWKVALIK